jgi:hypothetical protein
MTSNNIFTTLSPGKQAQIIADLMDLFRSNERGYGVGEFEGAKFNEDKQKWIPGHVRWTWGKTEETHWRHHLEGVRLLGQGVLCDDGKVWYGCLDIDKYEIDYHEEMQKIRKSKLPLVVFRTKSGGLRIIVFFCEAIEADTVIQRMRRVASVLGYYPCEIFPKQTSLVVENDDCPSWIYVPFGGTHGMFPEQGCMSDNGGLMDFSDAIDHMKSMRISRAKFMELFAAEDVARTNGKTNGKKHPKGAWVEEESYETTINTMFWDGPPCMWIIAHRKCYDMKNNFLVDVSTFLKRKYPENWEKALEWVNYNVLQPVGDMDKLADIVKRVRGHEYEYKCHDEPIHSFCDPHGCRRKPYGVGTNGRGGIDFHEMGMTIVLREPRLFIITFSEIRMMMDFDTLWTQRRFQVKCGDYGVVPPHTMKKEEWENIINKNIENATHVEPSQLMRTDAYEVGLLRRWLSIRVPTFMRIGEQAEDRIRVKVDERRVYMKWFGDGGLGDYCRSPQCNASDYEKMTQFFEAKCVHHKQEIGNGIAGWWRGSYSISLDVFDEETIEKWLNADKGEYND